MPSDNPEESFTFVDKRRLNPEPEAETAAPETSYEVEPDVEDLDEFDGSEPAEQMEDTLGAFGLVSYVTGLIASDAWQRMGLITDPTTGKINADLSQARFSIDCVAALVGTLEKHESSIPKELLRDLQRVLSDLRMNFVEQSHRLGQQ